MEGNTRGLALHPIKDSGGREQAHPNRTTSQLPTRLLCPATAEGHGRPEGAMVRRSRLTDRHRVAAQLRPGGTADEQSCSKPSAGEGTGKKEKALVAKGWEDGPTPSRRTVCGWTTSGWGRRRRCGGPPFTPSPSLWRQERDNFLLRWVGRIGGSVLVTRRSLTRRYTPYTRINLKIFES